MTTTARDRQAQRRRLRWLNLAGHQAELAAREISAAAAALRRGDDAIARVLLHRADRAEAQARRELALALKIPRSTPTGRADR